MKPLVLTGAIPGLLRRGSPVANQGGDERAVVVSVEDPVAMYVAIRTADPHPAKRIAWYGYTQRSWLLDLTDPTGRYHALLWLRERGHDLRWAEDEAEVLAWSVLSVSRGGRSIVETLKPWRHNPQDSLWTWGRWSERPRYGGPRVSVNARGWTFGSRSGPETGPEGRASADRAALAAGYALRNDDGTLTLPELPEVTGG